MASAKVRVFNETRGEVLADQADLADSFASRFWGLMGRSALPHGSGLVLRPGGGIHTFGMRFPIDVLHLDAQTRVTHVVRGIVPWRLGPVFVGGAEAVELPSGAAAGTQVGDVITITSG